MSLRIPKKDIPQQVLGIVRRETVAVRLVFAAPSLQYVRNVLASKDAHEKVTVALSQDLEFNGARRMRDGIINVSGSLMVEELELEDIKTLTIERDGSYSFIGVHHTYITWEYNYNAGTGRSDTYVTYKIFIPSSGTGTYEVLDRKTGGG